MTAADRKFLRRIEAKGYYDITSETLPKIRTAAEKVVKSFVARGLLVEGEDEGVFVLTDEARKAIA